MKQVTKFYLSSFLKNQTYFTPIMILFLQVNHLSFQQIFWVFTIGSIISFIAEIPTGIFADLYGKKKSIIIAWFGVFLSFLVFGFSKVFWMFVLAQALYELGNSFRTGTETAYIYDYLKETNESNYKLVKANQKVYARIGEAIATALGGFIVVLINKYTGNNFGYNAVFFVAAIPAFLNFVNVSTWRKIKEKNSKEINLENSIKHTKESLSEIFTRKHVLILTLNIMIFESILVALEKFIQPYMVMAGVPVVYFGIVYTISLIITVIAIKYSNKIEGKIGQINTINILTFLAVIPIFILGTGFVAIIGVALFFFIVIIENIRSPIANDEFHSNIQSETRATSGSILELSKSVGKIAVLPFAGWLSDTWSMFTAMIILGIILLIGSLLFYIRKNGNQRH